jgi:hypothetical protein
MNSIATIYKQSLILVSSIIRKEDAHQKYQVDRLLYVGWVLKNLSRDLLWSIDRVRPLYIDLIRGEIKQYISKDNRSLPPLSDLQNALVDQKMDRIRNPKNV